MNRRAVMIAGSLLFALLVPGSQANASGFSYAIATPPTISTAGSFTNSLMAVASADGPMTIDLEALDGTTVTAVDDPACAVTETGVHCAYAAVNGQMDVFGLAGSYTGSVVHLRVSASDAGGPVTIAPDMSYPVLPATFPPMPPLPTPAPSTPPVFTPIPISPPTTEAAAFVSRKGRVITLTNAQRTAHGLGTLTVSPQLTESATRYAQHLASDGNFSHTDGSSLAQRVTAAGYQYHWIGENLGMGQTSPRGIVTAWMNSPDHRTNMLDKRFTQIGVGIATRSDGQIIWCIDLGWPKTTS